MTQNQFNFSPANFQLLQIYYFQLKKKEIYHTLLLVEFKFSLIIFPRPVISMNPRELYVKFLPKFLKLF